MCARHLWGSPNGGPNGLGYGIPNAGDDPGSGNAPVTGGVPLISTGVLYELSGLPGGFTLEANVSKVSYSYSTAHNPTPAPGSGLPVMLGLATNDYRKCQLAGMSKPKARA